MIKKYYLITKRRYNKYKIKISLFIDITIS